MGVEEEISEIEEVLAERPDDYFKNQAMVARYGELISHQEYGTAVNPGDVHSARRQEIESEMAAPQNRSRYWANTPEGERMRQEYADILEGRAPSPSGEPVEPAGPTVVDAMGVHADEVAVRVGEAFANVDTEDLDHAYLGLCDEAQIAVARLLADPSVLSDPERKAVFVGSLSDQAWDEFRHFETTMTEPERGAFRRACLVA